MSQVQHSAFHATLVLLFVYGMNGHQEILMGISGGIIWILLDRTLVILESVRTK